MNIQEEGASRSKRCSKCKTFKPISEFHSNGPGKLRSACKRCESHRDKLRNTLKGRPKPQTFIGNLVTENDRLAAEFRQWERSENPFDGRFEVDPESDCWNWSGSICPAGYGVMVKYGTSSAHRVIMAHLGHTIKGLHVHHTCHNRKCINPDHLQVMTIEDHSALHGEEWSNGHDIGPDLPKNTTKAYMMARQAVSEYLQALPLSALVIPKARPNQYQATTAKALRVSTMSKLTGISGYLVAEVVRKFKPYESLCSLVTVSDN